MNASFGYDGFGRRRAKTVGGTTTQFLYDGLNPVQELASGTPTANVLTGLGIDEYFRRTDATTTRYYMTDALGSPIGLSDGAGAVQTEYTYEPFGGSTTSGASTTNSIGFTGREADGTGVLFYRARYYDPRLQRFIADDPIGFNAGDANLQAYVGNAPADLVDPTGEFAAAAVPLARCIGGAIGAGGGMWLAGRKPRPWDLVNGCLMGLGFGLPGAGAWLPMLRPGIPALPRLAPLFPRIASRLPGPLRRLLPPVRPGGGGRPQFRDPFGAETFAGPDAPFWSKTAQGARGFIEGFANARTGGVASLPPAMPGAHARGQVWGSYIGGAWPF